MSFQFKFPEEELAKLEAQQPEVPKRRKSDKYPSRGFLVGGLLATIAVAILLRSFVFTAGYNTTLVSNIGMVRTPVSGVAGQLSVDVGDRVDQDQVLGTVAARIGLSAALQSGSADLSKLNSELTSLDSRIAALEGDAGRIKAESRLYRDRKQAQLTAERDQATADMWAAQSRMKLASQQLDRAKALSAKGFVSTERLERAEQDFNGAQAALSAAGARQRQGTIELQAAGAGLLLTNGYSDVQYSTQRLSDLTLMLSELRARRETVRSSIAELKSIAGTYKAKDARVLRVPLNATVNGRVWAKIATSGESVQEGDPVYVLADCSSFFAYFSVGRRTYSQLSVGQPVTFYSYSTGDEWPGAIVNMGVSDPSMFKLSDRIMEPSPGDYLIGARIKLDPDSQKRCPVGIAGRIVL